MLEDERGDDRGAFGAVEAGEDAVFGFVADAAFEGAEGRQAKEGCDCREAEATLTAFQAR